MPLCVLAGTSHAFKQEYMCAGGLQNQQFARGKDKNQSNGADMCAGG